MAGLDRGLSLIRNHTVRKLCLFLVLLLVVALVADYGRDSRVNLFPRRLSPSDRILVGFRLNDLNIEYSYDAISGRFLVSQKDRFYAVPLLVQAGLPSEPDYDSDPESADEQDLLLMIKRLFNSSEMNWERREDKALFWVRSSFAVRPDEVKSLCRLIGLYLPDIDIEKVEMKLDVGTDLLEEDLERYGRASFAEEQLRQTAVQSALQEVLPGMAKCAVSFTYEPPEVFEDDIDGQDFSKYVLSERVSIEVFIDETESQGYTRDEVKELIVQAGGLNLLFPEAYSIEFKESSWAVWQRELAAEGQPGD